MSTKRRVLEFIPTIDHLMQYWISYQFAVPMDLVSLIALYTVNNGGVPYLVGFNGLNRGLCGVFHQLLVPKLTHCVTTAVNTINDELRFESLAINSGVLTLYLSTDGQVIRCVNKVSKPFERVFSFTHEIVALNSGCDNETHFVCIDVNNTVYKCDIMNISNIIIESVHFNSSYVIIDVSCGGNGLSVFLTQCGTVLCSSDNQMKTPNVVSWFVEK